MTNPDNVGGLLPCPFCGGEAQLSDGECGIRGMPMNWRNPRCTRCGCDLGYCHHIEAVERWNRRAELCRAAPAGGDAVAKLIAAADVLNTGAKLGLSTYTEDWKRLDMVLAAVKSKDSAPAGSGEVHPIPQELFDRAHRLRELAAANRLNECLPTIETMCGKNAGDAIRDAAALLRKLQQGAE